ncbi:MAG: glycosyltransferase family 4 protein [Planctomycetota bacterium]|jgi:glycosyltransferase involved in cell wall biosynthesis
MLAFTHYLTDARVRREAEALAARGDEVDLICCHSKTLATKRIHNGVRLYPLHGLKYRGGSTVAYLFSYLVFFTKSFFLISYLHLKKRYDVIQVHTMPDFLVFAASVPKLLGAKIILDVHDLMPELYMTKFELSEKHALIRFIRWVEKRSIAFAHKAIAVNVPHRDILIEHGSSKEKFSILLNLPDPAIFGQPETSQQTSNGRFRLIFHGIIARRQGLETAIRAVAQAKKDIPDIDFSIIGVGEDRERLVGLVDEMGLNDCIRFSDGAIPLEEVPLHIKQADIGMVPILNDSFTRYGLPVKVLEYVGLQTPVISSRTPTLEFYFDDTMLRYFEPGNETELAEHLIDLYRYPNKRELLVSNANKFNEEFNWNNQKVEYYKLVDSLCSKAEA